MISNSRARKLNSRAIDSLGSRSRLHTPAPRPAQARIGCGSRPIFAANPSIIADLVEDAQDVCEIDFAVIGFMPIRDAGDLHMRVRTREFANVSGKIPFGDLAVIEVELQLDIVRARPLSKLPQPRQSY